MVKQSISFHAWLALFAFIGLFVVMTYIAQAYEEPLKYLISQGGPWGMVGYVGITIGAVVVAPFSTLPLMPIATVVWGWVPTAVLSIVSWTIGAQIAFILARRYGAALVERMVSLEKVRVFEAMVPHHNLFWTVVLLRMTIPVDVLSYALGLFSHLPGRTYFWATLVGVSPFAFVLAYLGTVPIWLEVLVMAVGASVLYLVWKKMYQRYE